jgi:hypothetical protein
MRGSAMSQLTVHLALFVLNLYPTPKGLPEPVISGPQPGKRVPGIFNPVAVHYAANPDFNGKRINPMCHYGPNPTIMIFARDVGPDLQKLVKRLDAEVGKLNGFRFGVSIILLTNEQPDTAVKKLRSLQDDGKVQGVTLAYLDSALPENYAIADEADVTVLVYQKYVVAANHAFRKGELNQRASDRIIADIDKIVPDILLFHGVCLLPGSIQSANLYVRRDKVKGPVTLKLIDLPKGVSADELVVGETESQGSLAITAAKNAALGHWSAKGIVTSGKTERAVEITIWVRQDGP